MFHGNIICSIAFEFYLLFALRAVDNSQLKGTQGNEKMHDIRPNIRKVKNSRIRFKPNITVRRLQVTNIAKFSALIMASAGIVISVQSFRMYRATTNEVVIAQASTSIVQGSTISTSDIVFVKYFTRSILPKVSSNYSVGTLVGSVAAVSIPKGGIITPSDLVHGANGKIPRQISFALPFSHAVGGNIFDGDRIDVLATVGTGPTAVTNVVARGVLVTAVNISSQSLSSTSDPLVTITIAAPDSLTTLAIANAASTATLWVDLANKAKLPNDAGTYQIGFAG